MRKSAGAFGLFVALTGFPIVACDDSGSDSSAAAAGSCEQACAKCSADPCADCASVAERFRPEVSGPLFECVKSADACSGAWSNCFVRAGGSASRRPIDDQYAAACRAKLEQCRAEGTSFGDDNCELSQVLTEAWVAKAEACIRGLCADAPGCLDEIFY
jgi:hypothetical protein